MILTGSAISEAVANGDIEIYPFDPTRIRPNSYDWRLGKRLLVCSNDIDAALPASFDEIYIPPDGIVLEPGKLYLGETLERTSSDKYAQFLNGDRRIGGLGIWVHVSAPLGHVGHSIQWTLEITVVKPVKIFYAMTFGRLVFFETLGSHLNYRNGNGNKYGSSEGVEQSQIHREL